MSRTGPHNARKFVAVVGAIALAGSCVPLAGAAKDDLVLISRQSAGDGGAGGDGESASASISADGRYVAFSSVADNLSSADNNVVANIFVRDTQTNATTLVSRQSAGDGGAGGGGDSVNPSISSDGRYVAFQSHSNNLSSADDDAFQNIFLRDTQANTTTLISRQDAGDGGAGGDGASLKPSISADGRYVAFYSPADNLSSADDNAVENVFVRDTQADTTTLISRQSAGDGGAGADDVSLTPSISADGRYVAFQSFAGNLTTGENAALNVFVRDTQTNATTLVSRQSAGDGAAGANGNSGAASISADGRYVAFGSGADNLSSADDNAFDNIFVRDTQADTTTLISRQSAGDGGDGGAGSSFQPSISADGRYVAFYSLANNLSSADSDQVDVFVRDPQTDATTLVSRQSPGDGGAGGDEDSSSPSISADGHYVAFQSLADNLSSLDSDGVIDVFLRDVLGEPPAEPPPTDTTAPELAAEAKAKQALGKALKVTVSCDQACTVDAAATATPKGHAKRAKKLKFKPASAQLAAGVSTKLKLKPTKKTARKLKAAAKAKASITLTATDAAANSSTETLKVKLR